MSLNLVVAFFVILSLAAMWAQCFPHNLFLHNFTEEQCNLIVLYNPLLSSHIGPTVKWWSIMLSDVRQYSQILPK